MKRFLESKTVIPIKIEKMTDVMESKTEEFSFQIIFCECKYEGDLE